MKKPNQNYWFRSKSYDAIENMEDPDDLYYDDMDSIVRGLEAQPYYTKKIIIVKRKCDEP